MDTKSYLNRSVWLGVSGAVVMLFTGLTFSAKADAISQADCSSAKFAREIVRSLNQDRDRGSRIIDIKIGKELNRNADELDCFAEIYPANEGPLVGRLSLTRSHMDDGINIGFTPDPYLTSVMRITGQ